MSLRFYVSLAFALLLSLPVVAHACLWDYDTLKQELARFPTTLELITGKFPRHSREFYEWRIRDRQAELEINRNNLDYYDDLAVAYEKIGEHDQAIATMLAKEKIRPGLYETYSNLGTFHILAGEFEEGLPYIDKALAINPNAHFGREKYQKWLVEYALTMRKDGDLTLPMLPKGTWGKTFDFFIAEKLGRRELTPDEVQAAIQGVLGMMRFANHDNPLLLEALGHLLTSVFDFDNDAKQLAARAYLQASYVMEGDLRAQQAYRQLALNVIKMQEFEKIDREAFEEKVANVERQFAEESSNADKWYADLHAQELQWIRDGKDADAEFDRYTAKLEGVSRSSRGAIFWVAGTLFVIVVVALLLSRRRRGPATGKTELSHAGG